VPDLAAYRSRIEREFAETLHPGQGLRTELDSGRLFNISLSPSLAEYPVVDAAFRVLRLRAGQVDIEEAGSLMRSRFLDAARGEYTSRALLDREARKLGEPELPVATLIRLAEEGPAGSSCPRLAALLSRWKKVLDDLPRRHMPGDWVPAFSDLLAAVGWPGEGTVSSVQYQILAAWNELLNEFAGLDRTAGSLTLDRAVDLLERLASSRQFQPESDPAPVQVLGVFEASGLRFDHLWLMGMHDGAWPKSGGPNPFLPLRLQLGSNVPGCSPQRRLQFARAQTRDLFASAGSVVVSYPRRDRDTDLRPSPLVGDLPEPGSPPEVAAPRISWSERLRRSSRMETIEDLFAPPWQGAGAEPARGGTSIFRLQAACPFRAAAQLRLGAEPLASPQPGLSAMDRGLLTHDALDRVWSELGSHEVLISASGEAPARIDDVVERAVEAAIQTIAERRAALRRSRFRNIEGRRLRKLIMEWLAIERQRARFVVISQESAHVVEVGGVKLAIRTDRADRMDDGTEVLIDYKTGEHTPREWNGDRPDEPQLPLYAATTDACLSGVFFGVVRAGRSGFRGECVADGLVPGVGGMGGGGEVSPRGRLGSRVREWGRVLSRLGEEFRRGFAVVDPKTSRACSGCSLTALCRIGDVAGPGQPRRADR
jgi:probable DNA repair protein